MNREILKEAGLTDYEISIYLTLLKNGQLSAYHLAEKTGLYRQVTYDMLNRLTEKGFVNTVKEGKSHLYKAIDPQIILEYLNERTEKFRQILPELNGLKKQSQEPLTVETYRGENVMRIALRDVISKLREKGGMLMCTAVDESVPWVKHRTVLEQYERDMVNFGIKERVIIKEGSEGIFKKGNSVYKKIPKKYFNPNPVQIYGDNVQIIVWGNPDHLIIIRSKEVAEAYRKQFELLWKNTKK
jgi:HTH-type transcriptional regulator, sugar sensing transcriptional regulator